MYVTQDELNERDARIFVKMFSESKDIETARKEANTEIGICVDIDNGLIPHMDFEDEGDLT